MKLIKTLLVLSFLSVMFFIVACEDKDNTPESATISGAVTFTGTWPTTGTASISMQTVWPPTLAPYAFKTIDSDDLNSNTEYSYSFENVAFGTYPAIAISWQDPDDSNHATNQHTLGAYGGVYPFVSTYGGTDPTAVTVSDILYELTTINIDADLKYVDACQKQITQGACEALDHCMWYPAGSMGPSQTSDGCY